MKGIVWSNNREKALEELTKVINSYLLHDIQYEINKWSYYNTHVSFTNGDIWEIRPATENSRGCRCNISYIDKDISKDFIDAVIKHSTTAQPFQAFNYF